MGISPDVLIFYAYACVAIKASILILNGADSINKTSALSYQSCYHQLPYLKCRINANYVLQIINLCFFREDGSMKFLTKGDNNLVDDRGLYAPGQLWLQRKDVVGRARGFVPYVGIVTILMNDYPKFKVSFIDL